MLVKSQLAPASRHCLNISMASHFHMTCLRGPQVHAIYAISLRCYCDSLPLQGLYPIQQLQIQVKDNLPYLEGLYPFPTVMKCRHPERLRPWESRHSCWLSNLVMWTCARNCFGVISKIVIFLSGLNLGTSWCVTRYNHPFRQEPLWNASRTTTRHYLQWGCTR